MSDLTPETLAEWRKDAETHSGASPGVMDLRILALLAAHAAEKAAREEAERTWHGPCFAKIGDLAARADKAEQERDDMERELRKSVRLEGERALASAAAKAQVAALRDGITAAHARVGLPDIHKGLAPDRCRACNVEWPCPTAALLARADAPKPDDEKGAEQ